MDKKQWSLPVYLKLAQIVMGLVAFVYILYVVRDIIVPVIFAILIAILLNPVVNFFHRRMKRVFAIILAEVAAIILFIGLAYFISSQIAGFSETLPEFKEKFTALWNEVINWLSLHLNTSKTKINGMVNNAQKEAVNNGGAMIGQTLGLIGSTVVVLVLIPVYIFMILFYKPLFLEFFSKLFPQEQHAVVGEVLGKTNILIQSYLTGLMLEMAIVAALNSIGLLIIGLDYAILLAIIGAILNIIPYLGGIIAMALIMIVAFTTKSPSSAFWVIVQFGIVQLIDNNFIIPKVVGSRVKINALVSIIGVLAGGALWGIAGMFLAIPIIAILKVVFDHIDPLKPFGFLLGDNQPDLSKAIFNFRYPAAKKKKS